MERNIRLNWEELVKEAVKRRKEQRLSQSKFALIVGVSKPTLSAFEQGDTKITVKNAMKILTSLGLN